MIKSFILIILSLFFLNACSKGKLFNNKSQITYIDCPKALILGPASKIVKQEAVISLNKIYSLNCYVPVSGSGEAIIDFDYLIDFDAYKNPNEDYEFEFVVFVTNKKENEKFYEGRFIKKFEIQLNDDDLSNYKNQIEFKDQIQFQKSIYDQGIKIFIGII